MSIPLVFHLLPNAHLDPVWLWDWREGLNEGITTVGTVLDLMEEYPELTFLRGEAVIYRHIQRTAPALFRRIRAKIEEGRWDVVGGTWVQPDSNLSSTETLCRHFEMGLDYFQKELGVRPTIAWQADSFGHPAGWPNILRSFGMEGFSFTRPQRAQFPLESPVFWWNGDHADRLLCYRQHVPWYCSERHSMAQTLDITLAAASGQPYRNVGVLFGLGNHGGGPTRRHLADVEKWREAHPEVEVRYSTLHGLFAALGKEKILQSRGRVPELRGEFGYCLRGCYSSAQKFKSLYRLTENAVTAAEITQAVIPGDAETPLGAAWESVLFNSFHDILPGSSIERAMEDQIAWTGQAFHQAHEANFDALNRLAAQVDTRVAPPAGPDEPAPVPVLIWNPLPRPFSGPVEIEVSMDYRPFFNYVGRSNELPFALREPKGKLIPFQEIATEHSAMPDLPWRKRVAAHLEIPALGWKVVQLGLEKITPVFAKRSDDCSAGRDWIANSRWRVSTGKAGNLEIRLDGKQFLGGRDSLRPIVFEDPWGSWGGMSEEPDSWKLDQLRERWALVRSEVIESGPERSRLWVRWEGRHSWLELTFDLSRKTPWIAVQGRLLWNERSARLQLVLPSMGPAVNDVPGSVVTRTGRGQVPVGRWFHRLNQTGERIGVASDVLSDADYLPKETRLTIARATRYANDVETRPADKPWQPAVDCGELKFRLALFTDGVAPDHVADSLLYPPRTLTIPPHPGELRPSGSLGKLLPARVRLLSAQPDGNGNLRIRVQNRSERSADARFFWNGQAHSLGLIQSQEILTRIIRG